MQTIIEISGCIALPLFLGVALFFMCELATKLTSWVNRNARRLHPIKSFKAWRKRREARAVVRLKKNVKGLQELLRTERALVNLREEQLNQYKSRIRSALATIHSVNY